MEYIKVQIAKPTHTRTYENTLDKSLYPQEARIMNLSYAGDICVDIKFSFGQTVEERRNIRIGRLPIMLGSSRCHLCGLSEK
jgi:DNA-directed RNA polymerase III subunit RPC2